MTDILNKHVKVVLGRAGHLCLILFSLIITVGCLYGEKKIVHPDYFIFCIVIYFVFMFCFLSTYTLYKVFKNVKVVDIDLFWLIPFGASVFYII